MRIVKAIKTCSACPSQWDAWTDTGQYMYLRYRSGHGTAGPTHDVDDTIFSFEKDDYLDGSIDLEEFCALAGIELALVDGES